MDYSRGFYYTLTGTGGRIWALLRQDTTYAAIVDQLLTDYDAPEDTIRADTIRLLEDLHKAQLLQVS